MGDEFPVDFLGEMAYIGVMEGMIVIKRALLILALVLGTLLVVLTALYFWARSGTLAKDEYTRTRVFETVGEGIPNPEGVFSVMTYNIGYLSGMTNNRVLRPPETFFAANLDTFIDMLAQARPDVIALQEVDFASRRSYFMDQPGETARGAGYRFAAEAVNWDRRYVPFPYWPPRVQFGKIVSGQAVLSRFPIASHERVVLRRPPNPFYYDAFYLDRLIQVVRIEIGEKTLVVLNVHLEAFDRETREKQAREVLKVYRAYKNDFPVLLLGDFNCVPPGAPQKKDFSDEPGTDFTGEETMALFLGQEGLKQAFPAPGTERDFTFPADRPTRKLDYIFYSSASIAPVETRKPGLDSSDHLPLMLVFRFL